MTTSNFEICRVPFDAKRSCLFFALATLLSVAVSSIGAFLSFGNTRIFQQLAQAFSEFGKSGCCIDLPLAMQPAVHFAGILIFSGLAIWCSYKGTGQTRLIISLQLLVATVAFQWFQWSFLHLPGQPLSLFSATMLGILIGYGLKLLDRVRWRFESQHFELKLKNQELLESRMALVQRDEVERRLLAADLHDQVLNDLRITLQRFENFAAEPNDAIRDEITGRIKNSMAQIREIMDDLCPVILEEFGLSAAVEDRLDRASVIGGFAARFCCNVPSMSLQELSSVEQQLIFRLMQESLTNVCKHAKASVVRVTIDNEDGQLVFRVIDDGAGIDAQCLKQSSRGILYMRLRAGLIGATVSWKSGPSGKGTMVEIRTHA